MTYLDKRERDKNFLGQGVAFPFQLNPAGRLALASGAADIEQSIRIILGTAPGERLMRPEFGCRAYELVFAPHDLATESLMIYFVKEALGRWEPRIQVTDVTIPDQPEHAHQGKMLVEIRYRIKATHDERSIVYPFYISGEEE
jgi:phage baseplate assembly protein W